MHTLSITGPPAGLGLTRSLPRAGSARLAAQGTPAPAAPLCVLVLRPPHKYADTHYRALWDVALDPLPSSWSPEPPVTSCTNTHTNAGLSQTPESLQHLAWTPSSSSCIIQMHTGLFSGLHGNSQVSSPTPSPTSLSSVIAPHAHPLT